MSTVLKVLGLLLLAGYGLVATLVAGLFLAGAGFIAAVVWLGG